MEDSDGDWEDVEVDAPDVTDRQTLITLAKMTSNAYVLPDSGEWWGLEGWNNTLPFGWEADADGLRGHVVCF
jgi:lipase ATG15